MKEVLESIISSLVDNRESFSIEQEETENIINFKVKVLSEEIGKVIGKQGRLAKSVRTVMKAVAGKEGKKVTIEFVAE